MDHSSVALETVLTVDTGGVVVLVGVDVVVVPPPPSAGGTQAATASATTASAIAVTTRPLQRGVVRIMVHLLGRAVPPRNRVGPGTRAAGTAAGSPTSVRSGRSR